MVRCRYLEKSLYEVGVQFDRKIQVTDFCASAMKPHILLVEDDDQSAKLAVHHLTALNAVIDHVEDGHQAVAAALSQIYNCVLMDLDMPVMDGLEATRKLRSEGYVGLIVACTGLSKPEDKQRALEAGCDRYLPKPFSKEDLSNLLKILKQEPLISSLQDDPTIIDLIEGFVREIPMLLRSLEAAFALGDDDALENNARTLKANAGGFGFEPISESAAALEAAVAAKRPKSEIKKLIETAANWCLLARSPLAAQGAKQGKHTVA